MLRQAVIAVVAHTADRVRNTLRANAFVRRAVAGARTLLTNTTDLAGVRHCIAVVGAISI
jgi:hypothetical protein